jgi:hypothetical protein
VGGGHGTEKQIRRKRKEEREKKSIRRCTIVVVLELPKSWLRGRERFRADVKEKDAGGNSRVYVGDVRLCNNSASEAGAAGPEMGAVVV